MIVKEVIIAYGHRNISAKHPTTLEITTESDITPRGDCIIGVKANKAIADLEPRFKEIVKRDDAILVILLRSGEYKDVIVAQGSSKLILSDKRRLIIRKSGYIEPATLGIHANKAAKDIDRNLIRVLIDTESILKIDIYAISLSNLDDLIRRIA